MKIFVVTEAYADKAMVRVAWSGEGFFFDGVQPAVPSLLVVELPKLVTISHAAVREQLGGVTLSQKHWRKATLDDYLDAANATSFAWHVQSFFTLAEIHAFAGTYGPALHADVRSAMLVADPGRRAAALRKTQRVAERVVPVLYASTNKIGSEALLIEVERDRKKVAGVAAQPFAWERWTDCAASLTTDTVKREALIALGVQLVRNADVIGATLDRLIAQKLDSVHVPELWTQISPVLDLQATEHGTTINLTSAKELTVQPSWEVYKARRVGSLRIGRTALRIVEGSTITYVRGERKLLHQVKSRGGTWKRLGCTLVLGTTTTPGARERLLEVDRIDTLANVDPPAAAALAKPSPSIANALANASDPRWRRILADLVIESVVGIDADIARRLSRAEGGQNRKRR